ncbi:hypothetical protein ACQ4M3_09780 [Leptolyngbya sp. AN03gr2]|uniref:hypothetical protein n=1 Tax=Leptolyngbya sp. AN03gr2 TaxID=3423364 RepID=UPI003D311EB9
MQEITEIFNAVRDGLKSQYWGVQNLSGADWDQIYSETVDELSSVLGDFIGRPLTIARREEIIGRARETMTIKTIRLISSRIQHHFEQAEIDRSIAAMDEDCTGSRAGQVSAYWEDHCVNQAWMIEDYFPVQGGDRILEERRSDDGVPQIRLSAHLAEHFEDLRARRIRFIDEYLPASGEVRRIEERAVRWERLFNGGFIRPDEGLSGRHLHAHVLTPEEVERYRRINFCAETNRANRDDGQISTSQCVDCKFFHGQWWGGQRLVCGMHPYGYEGQCTDKELRSSDS